MDADLVAAVLDAVCDLSDREAGVVLNLSHEQVRRYRNGIWEQLSASTRRKLRAFVERLDPGEAGWPLGPRFATDADEALVEGVLTRELRKTDDSGAAFDAVHAKLREMHRSGGASDGAIRYWEALCVGAHFFGGYEPPDPAS